MEKMNKIAHIINPVRVDKSSDLYFSQPITIETILRARTFDKDRVDVSIFTAQFPEERGLIPDSFIKTPDLERSVLDHETFKKKRKLPLLKDILDRLFEISDADYFIYSNIDIAVMPYFYSMVTELIEVGYDSFVINRRTILNNYHRIDEIPLMYSEIGEKHIGHDCFVFKRDMYPDFKLGNVCIGIRLVGRVLLWNLVINSKHFQEFKDLHLTFHLGNNKLWQNPDFKDYDLYNQNEARKVFLGIQRKKDLLCLLNEKYPDYLIGINMNDIKVKI